MNVRDGCILGPKSIVEPDDPILPDEVLLRRVPELLMSAGSPRWPLAKAFEPRTQGDEDGLSVYRRCFRTPQEAADFRTKSKSNAWVAELRASAIMSLGLTIKSKPLGATADLPAQPGHAVLLELNSADRKTPQAEEWKQGLLAAVINLTGPYAPPNSPRL